jgi:hypothetical protein
MATKKRNLKRLFADHKAAWIAGCCGIVATIGAQMVAGHFKSSPLPAQTITGTNISHAVLISGNQTGNNTIDDHSHIAQQSVSVSGNNYGIINPTQINNFGVDPNMANKISKDLSGLDDKTTDIETLPDGRTVIGGAIVTTKPRVILEKANAGGASFVNGDYAAAFERFKEVIYYFENPPSPAAEGYALQIGQNYFPDQMKAYLYGMAAQSAMSLGSNSVAISYAEKAVNTYSVARNLLILWNCQMAFAFECLRNKNYKLGFDYLTKAVNTFESAKTAGNDIVGIMTITNANGAIETKTGGAADMVPDRQVSQMYFVASLAAFETSSNSLAREYLKKAIIADRSNSAAVDLAQKIKLGVN